MIRLHASLESSTSQSPTPAEVSPNLVVKPSALSYKLEQRIFIFCILTTYSEILNYGKPYCR
ncbi:hypothetical protein PL9631_660144 [Planktothrix paucivesiculata PCC 9631]|uniref:Uncharacterized protein n=1 Tax=Planktothrix paucivesiculata PCC 9631 TaxID=671071 RepID=A0A7Z9BWV7_9CYAN|nr:hypothetical protein PL9631_660144 [Planktothrix paucivesiculata PCC 9631]